MAMTNINTATFLFLLLESCYSNYLDYDDGHVQGGYAYPKTKEEVLNGEDAPREARKAVNFLSSTR